jgi:hypothetical protein
MLLIALNLDGSDPSIPQDMLHGEPSAQECDARNDARSNVAGNHHFSGDFYGAASANFLRYF